MEKTVEIGGRIVTLKATAKLPVIYETQFNKNYMEVQNGILQILKTDENGNAVIDISKLDYLGFCQIVWAMEKSANPDIAPFDEWLDSLDSLPMIDTIGEIIELLMANLISKSKIKNADAAADSPHTV